MLDRIALTTEDKSPQVIVKLGELAKEVAKGVAARDERGDEGEVFNSTFNPTDPVDVQRLNSEKDLLEAQKNLIDLQQALLESKKKP